MKAFEFPVHELTPGGGYSHIRVYRDVLWKWVSFSQEILRHRLHFLMSARSASSLFSFSKTRSKLSIVLRRVCLYGGCQFIERLGVIMAEIITRVLPRGLARPRSLCLSKLFGRVICCGCSMKASFGREKVEKCSELPATRT